MSNKLSLIVIFFCIFSVTAFAEDVKVETFINDYANIITPEYKTQIETVLVSLQKDGISEFAIVTVNSSDGKDIDSYAYTLAEGVLGDKEKNNGLLLLILVEDRKYRFEVGRGLEQYLNDAKIGRIGRTYIVPNFKGGDYGKGILESTLAVDSVLRQNIDSEYYVKDKNLFQEYKTLILIIIFILISILLSLAEGYSTKKSNDKYFIAAIIASQLLGGGRRGGGGGGFGGFGGGGFGGGGAGGNW